MWALVDDSNNVTNVYGTFPPKITINDRNYDGKELKGMSEVEKNAIKIYEVTPASRFDENYYVNSNASYAKVGDKVVETITKAADKALADVNAVDENGDPVLDDDGVQLINYGLKTDKKKIIKQQASGLLEKTDWHNHKALDDDTYTTPDNIKTYRANVRAKSNEMETQIDACTNVDELKALYEYTEQDDGTITRPLAEFPEEI